MTKTKESDLYLLFSKKHWLIILIFGLIGLVVGFYFSSYYTPKQITNLLYKIDRQPGQSFVELNLQTDQLVSELRSEQFKQQILPGNSSKESTFQITKYAPGLFTIDVSSFTLSSSRELVEDLNQYMKTQPNIKLIEPTIEYRENIPENLFILLGFISGSLVGLIISLFITYRSKY